MDRTVSLDPEYRRTGVQLTLPEVLSLHFGRTLFAFLDDTQFAQDLEGALERLEPAISRAHQELAQDLDRKFMAVAEHAKSYAGQGDLIDEVLTSLIYDNPAKAEYTKASGVNKSYELEPLTLATYRQGLYLFARDRGDDRIKSFAVERFVRYVRQRMDKFTPPADYDPNELVRSAFGIISAPPAPISVVFAPSAALYVRERDWHPTQSVHPLPDGRTRIELHVGITQELVSWLSSFGAEVVVEAPPVLRERLRDVHARALQAYQ
jgi:proteasome accessory factor B